MKKKIINYLLQNILNYSLLKDNFKNNLNLPLIISKVQFFILLYLKIMFIQPNLIINILFS